MTWGFVAVGVGSLVGGYLVGEATKDSANTYAEAGANANAMTQEQYAQVKELLRPYAEGGEQALNVQQSLLGLNGEKEQQNAISGIENSSMFQTLSKQGENAILANASATGGLRGGNTQGALAQFRPSLLNDLIQQQYTNLGGMTSIGQNAAAGIGNTGMATAGMINQNNMNVATNSGNAALANANNANNMVGMMSGLGFQYANRPQPVNGTL